VGKFINKEKKMVDTNIRYIKGNKTGEYYKIGPDDRDWKFGLTEGQLKKEIKVMIKVLTT
tara:strand:- start:1372 stop:1551 length:180 start_codon:yes stop_codon:yes gene_type:complete